LGILIFGPLLNYYFNDVHQAAEQSYIGLFIRKAKATDFSLLTNVGWRYRLSMNY